MEKILVRSHEELRQAVCVRRQPAEARLGEILLAGGLIDSAQLDEALARQGRERSRHLGRILIDSGAVDAEQVNAALAVKLGIPWIRLDYFEIDPQILSRVPAELALQHGIMPLAELDGTLIVAMENPLDGAAQELIRFHTNANLSPVMASARDIALAHSRYYSQADEDEALESVVLDPQGERPRPALAASLIEREARKRPIVRLLNAIVLQGILRGASDINIRPGRERVNVYYRIDGKLHYSRSLHKSLQPALVSRVKIIGDMNIAERRLPQEGNARLARGGQAIDLRLSVLPTVNGESVVIRILDKENGLKPFARLGLPEAEAGRVKAMLRRPHGLLLVTGPTGSGKSTTLYALLNEARKTGAHILTVEDPVEYAMDGIEQVQVSNKIGRDFSEVLRRFLRHDPDVIMVGEIRDEQTAAIACQAALTGHLVLSTLHTNDAPSAVTRLLDMGVAPYVLASTLLGVVAQRLVRLNCPQCLRRGRLSQRRRAALLPAGIEVAPHEVFARGAGCAACHFTGYAGRTLVAEVLSVTAELAALIGSSSPTRAITELALSQGMRRLADNALQLARAGRTSVEEVVALKG